MAFFIFSALQIQGNLLCNNILFYFTINIDEFSYVPEIVNLIHDNQLESKNILENTLNLMKQDYDLPEYYNLTFEDSKNNILIQVADILAGSSRIFTEKYLAKNLSLIESEIFKKIRAISDINFILP